MPELLYGYRTGGGDDFRDFLRRCVVEEFLCGGGELCIRLRYKHERALNLVGAVLNGCLGGGERRPERLDGAFHGREGTVAYCVGVLRDGG